MRGGKRLNAKVVVERGGGTLVKKSGKYAPSMCVKKNYLLNLTSND